MTKSTPQASPCGVFFVALYDALIVLSAKRLYNGSSKKTKESTMDQRKMGGLIRRLRKENGWTQRQLAEKMNISDKTVSKWERGVSHN